MWLLSLPWSDRICFSKVWEWWHTTALAVEGFCSQIGVSLKLDGAA